MHGRNLHIGYKEYISSSSSNNYDVPVYAMHILNIGHTCGKKEDLMNLLVYTEKSCKIIFVIPLSCVIGGSETGDIT